MRHSVRNGRRPAHTDTVIWMRDIYDFDAKRSVAGEPALVMRDVVKVYRSRRVRSRALRGVSFFAERGEFAAIVGTSGSGKSTLLNLAAGLERPSSGEIYVLGRPVSRMGEEALTAFRLSHVGFVFQSFNLLAELTVEENVAFPLTLRGVREAERRVLATGLLERVGLAERALHYPDELSGGQQQRAAIARALVTDPEILFADEPTGNLDSKTADQVMDILVGAVRERGMTLLMVTHDMEKAEQADRILRIRDGEAELPAQEDA